MKKFGALDSVEFGKIHSFNIKQTACMFKIHLLLTTKVKHYNIHIYSVLLYMYVCVSVCACVFEKEAAEALRLEN